MKPQFFKSPTLRRLPIEARYLAIGLFTEADDDGRFIASPKLIAGSIFPHDERVTPARVDKWLRALAACNGGDSLVKLYEVDGVIYGHFPKWRKHQRISHPTPSILPNPAGIPLELLGPDMEQGTGKGNREQGDSPTANPPSEPPTNDTIYLASQINDTWPGKAGRLSPAALQRFVNVYGAREVESCVRELHGFPPAEAVRSPYAYLEAMLRDRGSA